MLDSISIEYSLVITIAITIIYYLLLLVYIIINMLQNS